MPPIELEDQAIGIIPARWASTRLPGKPLVDIGGRPMIEWVYRKVKFSLARAIVATDDMRIFNAVQAFGGEVMLTRTHQSGTDRCAEVVRTLQAQGPLPKVIINVQGDEPFVQVSDLRRLARSFRDPRVHISTLVRAFHQDEDVDNVNWPKVVLNHEGFALMFSRSVIPYARNAEPLETYPRWKHIGIYAFKPETLLELAELPVCPLEQIESLEQLRWLHAGYSIFTVPTRHDGLSVDTPEDVEAARYKWAHLGEE